MTNTNYNKVIYNGNTLMDLTTDTVESDKLLSGYTAHDKSGATITGTCTYDVDSTDADAAAAELLVGKTAYVSGAKVTGTMVDNEGVEGYISTKEGTYTVPVGYHDGSGSVALADSEKEKLVANNIKLGIELFGVIGTCEPSSDVTAQAKTCTPSVSEQVISPDEDVDYLSQVTVAAIPYVEASNAAGGTTVTIG